MLTALQSLPASREHSARQHASGRQALQRQHIFALLSAGNTSADQPVRKLRPTRLKQKLGAAAGHSLPSHVHAHKRCGYLSTENILAIFPMARILFLITSFRAAAALAEKEQSVIPARRCSNARSNHSLLALKRLLKHCDQM